MAEYISREDVFAVINKRIDEIGDINEDTTMFHRGQRRALESLAWDIKSLKPKIQDIGELIEFCEEIAQEHDERAEKYDRWDEEETDYVFFKAEAKKLLKAAVEDFDYIYSKLGDNCEPMSDCEECPFAFSKEGCYCKWRYAGEVKKLINSEK